MKSRFRLNYGIADFRDPFLVVDGDGLAFEGQETLGDSPVQRFAGKPRNWAKEGVLDTRKGFSIPYRSPGLQTDIRLYVSLESGLLRRVTGNDLSGELVLKADYHIEGINVALDESLFTLEESGAAYRTIDITDTMLAGLDPDAADGPPSRN